MRLSARLRRHRVTAGVGLVLAGTLATQAVPAPAFAVDPWNGTISLAADTTQTDVNAPTAKLTATFTQAQSAQGMCITIYDDAGTRLVANDQGTSLSKFVTPATGTTRSYKAFVAVDCPASGLPQTISAQSGWVSVTNVGYTGVVTLAASPASTSANSPNSVVTATLSKPVVDVYAYSLYDNLGTRLACNSGGSSYSSTVSPPINTTRTYTAYVAKDCPTGHVPVVDVKTSASTSVTNVGYDGSLSLVSSRSQTDANDLNAVLTGTLTKPLVNPYSYSVYDDLGTRIKCDGPGGAGSPYSATVAPALNASRTYTGYVAQDCPTGHPPVVDIKTSSSVTVQNVGYNGSITMTVDPATTDANDPSTTLKIHLSKVLPDPYALSLYDDTNTRISCQNAGYSDYNVPITTVAGRTRTYTAYVAQDCPSNAVPTVDVRGTSATPVANVGYNGSISVVADTNETDVTNPYANLAITLSKVLPSPYVIAVYDEQGNRAGCYTSGYLNYSSQVSPSLNTAHSYTVVVALDCPASNLPAQPNPAGSSTPPITGPTTTVTNRGWTGSLALTTSSSSVDASDAYATLTATASKSVPYPYYVSVYDVDGQLVCENASNYLGCSGSIGVGSEQVRSFRAYVAQDAPADHLPTVDVHASSNVVSVYRSDLGSPLAYGFLAPTGVTSLASALEARYGEEACLQLGETVRTNAAESSVPDVTLICNAKGVVEALKFVARVGALVAVESLVYAVQDPQHTNTHPDCQDLDASGNCLDEGEPPATLPAPAGSGQGILPPSNCLSPNAAQALRDSMSDQDHHVATIYGKWGLTFKAIADKYGLSLNDSWNMLNVPHAGPHPHEYHEWVLENMIEADDVANGDPAIFVNLYQQWVVNVVDQDSSIVRLAYWLCYR